MPKTGISQGTSGMVAISAEGDSLEITDVGDRGRIEGLIEARKNAGKEISRILEAKGLQGVMGEEPTEVINDD
jgi:hypothetical protein